ncbi:DUF1801 domain-containing protein [Fusobacterium varium]|uniref:DUF1801 domain-containing protein n=1 Tax=Fusobacterium TaxID=848 RepID=UPI0030CFDC00
MNKDIQNYIMKYSNEIQKLFYELRILILQSASYDIEEKLWAGIPSYYIGKRFIRLIPFKDHINIEAAAIIENKNKLQEFKVTPKGMLQIYCNQAIPVSVLKIIFKNTLSEILDK